MQTIREGVEAALTYIESHLTDEMDVHNVAARAYISAFHFQRIFSALCGMPLGEYIRCRRLTRFLTIRWTTSFSTLRRPRR